MKNTYYPILLLVLYSCTVNESKFENNESPMEIMVNSNIPINDCDYHEYFKEFGNSKMDSISLGGHIFLDQIDDTITFMKLKYNLYFKDNKIYKKSKAAARCNGNTALVEFYKDFTYLIDLDSYFEYDETYFTTDDTVYFWWTNSDGHFPIKILDADPSTFKPNPKLCGGTDKNGVFYGGPNRGVHKLEVSDNVKYKFLPNENNYWNSPSHKIEINGDVFNIEYEFPKGYYIDYDNPL